MKEQNKKSLLIGATGSIAARITEFAQTSAKDNKPKVILIDSGDEGAMGAAKLAAQAKEHGLDVVVMDHADLEAQKLKEIVENQPQKESLMNLKNRLGMMALTSLMMGGVGMGLSHRYDDSAIKKPRPIPKPLHNINPMTGVPKGHKVETVDLHFKGATHVYTIRAQFSYGTAKSRAKRLNALQRELAEYIAQVPDALLRERNEFTITPI